jgi:hypothetical protein
LNKLSDSSKGVKKGTLQNQYFVHQLPDNIFYIEVRWTEHAAHMREVRNIFWHVDPLLGGDCEISDLQLSLLGSGSQTTTEEWRFLRGQLSNN